jgi:O-antigen ligase
MRIAGAEPLGAALVWLVVATSGVVLFEPAPFDGLMVMLMGAAVAAGLRVPRHLAPLVVLLGVMVACDLLGSTQASAIDRAATHSLITLYLAASAVFFACLAAWRPEVTVPLVLSAVTLAAVLASIAGLVGYLGLVPGAEALFTLFGRAKGTFEDPNVFGPFLVLPILFGLERVLTGPVARNWYWPAVLALLAAGMFLSFSRGAWANLAIALPIFLAILLARRREAFVRRRAAGLLIVGGVLAAFGIAFALSFAEVGDLFAERASLEQGYDVGAQGRFAGQIKAVEVIVEAPFGVGATGFQRFHRELPHNVYLNIFLNAGWAGGFAYLALVGLTIVRGLDVALRGRRGAGLTAAVFAAFLATALEGLIVDTDHWRHFYLQLGLVWGAVAAFEARPRGT